MSTYLEKAQQLQNWISEGKSLEALDEFYAENVQVYEMANGVRRNGKSEQREAIQQWFGSVKEMHGTGCNSICADEQNAMTTAETWVDMTMQNGTRVKMEEVAVQKWENGKIVEEKFYYNQQQ